MTGGWGLLALVVVVGVIGSFFVARRVGGVLSVLGCAAWLVLPFVAIAVILASEADFSLATKQASDSFWLGFFILSLIGAVPWMLACAVGGSFGLYFRKRPPPDETSFAAAPDERTPN